MKCIKIFFITTVVIFISVFAVSANALTKDQILCRCTYFVEWYTGVKLPEYIRVDDTHINPGVPPKDSIAMFWIASESTWHTGIAASTTPEGIYLISSNLNGKCGLSLIFVRYSDHQYSGYWIN